MAFFDEGLGVSLVELGCPDRSRNRSKCGGRAPLSDGMKWFSAGAMPTQDAIPDILRRFGIPEQFAILEVDDALIRQILDVNRSAPIAFAHEHDRNGLDFPGLDQGKHLE